MQKISFAFFLLLFNLQYASGQDTQAHSPFDVLINEIMVRPSPPAGLPEAEYIELYNRSEHPVDLADWSLHVGTRSRTLPPHLLRPDEYLLVVHKKYEGMLDEFGDVLSFEGFPVLPVSGQVIVLKDAQGNMISAVSYSEKWYGSAFKSAGGWSLEQIDPFNPCGGKGNWMAPEGLPGGTPGQLNSATGNNADITAPEPTRATVPAPGELTIHFDEPMHPLSDWSPDNFYAEGLGHPLSVTPEGPFFDNALLQFDDIFTGEKDYILKAGSGLFDCAGNQVNENKGEVRFTMPVFPEYPDVVINEILFNPFPGGEVFVELLNVSEKTIDLRHLYITGVVDDLPEPSYVISPGGYLLFPREYAVLSVNPEIVNSHYFVPDLQSLITIERMPPLNAESGRVALYNQRMEKIDDVGYTSDMHSPLLVNVKGISLERINHKRPASDLTNWNSASENCGFATPGYRNSQFSAHDASGQGSLSVDPEIFSPDNSGHNDVVNISYKLDKPGFTGSIRIFDSMGRPVKRLVRNEILGTSGTFSWDGRNESNGQSGLGIYLILMEVFHPDGEVRKFRKTVVLGGRFRK